VTAFGLLLVGALAARGYRASLVVGIVVTTVFSIVVNWWTNGAAYATFPGTAVVPSGIFGAPDFSNFGLGLTLTAVGKVGLVTLLVLVGSVMLSDFFDTYGTIQGVGRQAGLVNENGEYPNGETDKILQVDSVGPILGGLFGSSSNTTYIESSAGVSAGGRTGLTAVVVGVLFLAAMFFTPIFQVVPPQATAPALILVGVYMLKTNLIPLWEELKDLGENASLVGWIPAALTIFVMPATYNITHGIGFGVVSYVGLMTLTGQLRKVPVVMWAVAVAFVLYFVFGTYA
jgi:AGZA family xanthine/uracil permease-like MFS transporter